MSKRNLTGHGEVILSIPGESERHLEAAQTLLERMVSRMELWMLLDATEVGSACEKDAYQRYQESRREVIRLVARGMTID